RAAPDGRRQLSVAGAGAARARRARADRPGSGAAAPAHRRDRPGRAPAARRVPPVQAQHRRAGQPGAAAARARDRPLRGPPGLAGTGVGARRGASAHARGTDRPHLAPARCPADPRNPTMSRPTMRNMVLAALLCLALPAQAALFEKKPEKVAAEAAAANMAAVTLWVDASWGFRNQGAANDLTRAHNAFAAFGYKVASVEPYIENGDLQGFFVTYQR